MWHDLCTSLCDLKHPSSIAVMFHAHVARKKELVSHLWDTATFIMSQDIEDTVKISGMKSVVEKQLNKWRVQEGECLLKSIILPLFEAIVCLRSFLLSQTPRPRMPTSPIPEVAPRSAVRARLPKNSPSLRQSRRGPADPSRNGTRSFSKPAVTFLSTYSTSSIATSRRP